MKSGIRIIRAMFKAADERKARRAWNDLWDQAGFKAFAKCVAEGQFPEPPTYFERGDGTFVSGEYYPIPGEEGGMNLCYKITKEEWNCTGEPPRPDRCTDDPRHDPATQAFDAIAKLCGCENWQYPGQIVRDVEDMATSLDTQKMLARKRLDELDRIQQLTRRKCVEPMEGDVAFRHVRDLITGLDQTLQSFSKGKDLFESELRDVRYLAAGTSVVAGYTAGEASKAVKILKGHHEQALKVSHDVHAFLCGDSHWHTALSAEAGCIMDKLCERRANFDKLYREMAALKNNAPNMVDKWFEVQTDDNRVRLLNGMKAAAKFSSSGHDWLIQCPELFGRLIQKLESAHVFARDSAARSCETCPADPAVKASDYVAVDCEETGERLHKPAPAAVEMRETEDGSVLPVVSEEPEASLGQSISPAWVLNQLAGLSFPVKGRAHAYMQECMIAAKVDPHAIGESNPCGNAHPRCPGCDDDSPSTPCSDAALEQPEPEDAKLGWALAHNELTARVEELERQVASCTADVVEMEKQRTEAVRRVAEAEARAIEVSKVAEQQIAAERSCRLPAGSLTPEQLEAACKNLGFDLTCPACASLFFTGTTDGNHKAECKSNNWVSVGLGPVTKLQADLDMALGRIDDLDAKWHKALDSANELYEQKGSAEWLDEYCKGGWGVSFVGVSGIVLWEAAGFDSSNKRLPLLGHGSTNAEARMALARAYGWKNKPAPAAEAVGYVGRDFACGIYEDSTIQRHGDRFYCNPVYLHPDPRVAELEQALAAVRKDKNYYQSARDRMHIDYNTGLECSKRAIGILRNVTLCGDKMLVTQAEFAATVIANERAARASAEADIARLRPVVEAAEHLDGVVKDAHKWPVAEVPSILGSSTVREVCAAVRTYLGETKPKPTPAAEAVGPDVVAFLHAFDTEVARRGEGWCTQELWNVRADIGHETPLHKPVPAEPVGWIDESDLPLRPGLSTPMHGDSDAGHDMPVFDAPHPCQECAKMRQQLEEAKRGWDAMSSERDSEQRQKLESFKDANSLRSELTRLRPVVEAARRQVELMPSGTIQRLILALRDLKPQGLWCRDCTHTFCPKAGRPDKGCECHSRLMKERADG